MSEEVEYLIQIEEETRELIQNLTNQREDLSSKLDKIIKMKAIAKGDIYKCVVCGKYEHKYNAYNRNLKLCRNCFGEKIVHAFKEKLEVEGLKLSGELEYYCHTFGGLTIEKVGYFGARSLTLVTDDLILCIKKDQDDLSEFKLFIKHGFDTLNLKEEEDE